MPISSGVIADVQEREASNGGNYVLVKFQGQETGFFDWDGKLQEAEAQVGDAVAVEHSDGEYPRIQRMKKLEGEQAEKARKSVPASRPQQNRGNRDVQIVRMTAIKAAARVVQGSSLDYEQRSEEITKLAGQLEEWVLR